MEKHKDTETPVKILPRADIVRSKLFQTFHLLDHLQGESRVAPKYNTKDIWDPAMANRLLATEHYQLVRFNICPVRNRQITEQQRRRSRLRNRCRNLPPLNMWAYWVLTSKLFNNTILILIFINATVLSIQAEVFDHQDPNLQVLKDIVQLVDLSCICVFILEIFLKLIDNFYSFWKSYWNIFDLVITVLSLLPEIIISIETLTGRHQMAVKIFRMFKILRCLKMVSKFQKARIIILAVTKAIKAMIFILLLLLIFAYIFAVAGIILFQPYTRSDRSDLIYQKYFKDLPNAFVTVFILFTNDHWYALLHDTWKVPELDKAISSIYILLWLLLGSFIFRNIFVGIMVDKFHEIRSGLTLEVKQIDIQQKADLFKAQIITRRLSQTAAPKEDPLMPAERAPQLDTPATSAAPTESAAVSQVDQARRLSEIKASAVEWESYVYKNLSLLKDQDVDELVTWPRDSLFRYFELLEKLQYNLEERKKLQNIAAQALLNLHDS